MTDDQPPPLTVDQARTDLLTFMGEYVRSAGQMEPGLQTFMDRGWTVQMWELAALQQIYRRMHYLRSTLVVGLFGCMCGSYEGEVHSSECPLLHRAGHVVRRPKGWTLPDPQPIPVELKDYVDKPCARKAEGCIYFALPGTELCAQHTEGHKDGLDTFTPR